MPLMSACGANPKQENGRVAAAIWGGADSFERGARDADDPRLPLVAFSGSPATLYRHLPAARTANASSI